MQKIGLPQYLEQIIYSVESCRTAENEATVRSICARVRAAIMALQKSNTTHAKMACLALIDSITPEIEQLVVPSNVITLRSLDTEPAPDSYPDITEPPIKSEFRKKKKK